MQNFGATELIIILVIVLLVFGASRLRGIGQGLGGAINAFRREVREGREEDAKEGEAKASDTTEAKAPPEVNQDQEEGSQDA
jgi:sec-independent protein translocase protein TatA